MKQLAYLKSASYLKCFTHTHKHTYTHTHTHTHTSGATLNTPAYRFAAVI